MPYEDDVVKRQREAIKQDVEDFDLNDQTFVKDHELDLKIENFANLTGFTTDQIKKELDQSYVLQAKFVKDPTKRGFSEDIAADLIQKIPGVLDFVQLPKRGKKTQWIQDGGILNKVSDPGMDKKTKSLDFQWSYQNPQRSNSTTKEVFATQKFTTNKAGGGHQSNVKKEMTTWISHAVQNKPSINPERILICLIDGSYWTDDRFKELEDLCDPRKNVFVCRIDNLEKHLSSLP